MSMKKYFFLSFFSLIAIVGVAMFAIVHAQDDSYGLRVTAEEAGILNPGEQQELSTLVGNVVGTALSMVGVLFFGLMIYGGILWMTARGNDDQTKKAFDTITAAVIGLVIILASYAITTFAFKTVSSNSASSGAGPAADLQAVCTAVADTSDCNFKRIGQACSTPGSSDGVCTGPADACTCIRRVLTGPTGVCAPKESRTDVTDCTTVIAAQCGEGLYEHCVKKDVEVANRIETKCFDKCTVTTETACDTTYCEWTPNE